MERVLGCGIEEDLVGMHCYPRRAVAPTTWGSLLLLFAAAFSSPIAVRATAAARPPQVNVRRVATLDVHGSAAQVFGPGSTIQLRIQWTVRSVGPRARQTVTWSVNYTGREILHTVKTAPARAGNWSEVTMVTVARRPNLGVHIFRGRVAVDGVTSTLDVAFTIRR
jgi:hypothetical protein